MLITIKEYADKVGRDASTIRHRILRGAMQAVKVGRDWLIDDSTPLVDGRRKE